jgi:hypothetical protein
MAITIVILLLLADCQGLELPRSVAQRRVYGAAALSEALAAIAVSTLQRALQINRDNRLHT